ncbi:MAG: trypsin-like peptidase domain-containing protein [Chloroflexi bacterium]|nr:trypsin-like peptidase domain-containing protein [Chloroflexota bacterium]
MSTVNTRVSMPVWLVTLSAVLVVLGIIGVGSGIASGVGSQVVSASPVLYDEQVVLDLFERVNPAVVEIEVVQSRTSGSRFSVPVSGQGSGFLVDTEGHILTNYHVVQNAASIRVILSDGRTLEAQVAGTSPADDVALLKVDSGAVDGIVPLPLGDSSAVRPGQMAIALGSPFGLDNTITVGVVSGVERSRTGILQRPITGMIQTDASINPGNSGGPLLDSLGEVMGINTSIETSANGATGIGFAVPINTAKGLITQFLESDGVTETVTRPWLGISGTAMSANLADFLGVGTSQGVYVVAVTLDSPAQEAGLIEGGPEVDGVPRPVGDIIIAVDGNSVRSVENLIDYFNTIRPGDSVSLTIVRAGQVLDVTVVLGEWPGSL